MCKNNLFLLLPFFCLTACGNFGESPGQPATYEPGMVDTSSWQTYQNSEYQIALRYPEDWVVTESPAEGSSTPVINIVPMAESGADDLPLDIHESAEKAFLVVYPGGLGTEYPSGGRTTFFEAESKPISLTYNVDDRSSYVFRLANAAPWGYFVRPDRVPDGWEGSGFLFAQYPVQNFSATCFDAETGTKKDVTDCDPMAGDRLVRSGQLDSLQADIVYTILKTIELGNVPTQTPIRELIRVEDPAPNLDIQSPYEVRGEAVGYWYNEGAFPVRLYDASDNLLAEGVAEAQGEWMTEEMVPFSVSLTFDAPDDERGELVLERANPSGLPGNDRSYTLPVLLGQ